MRTIKFRAWVVNDFHNTMFYPEEIKLNSACAKSLWYKVGFTTDMPDEYENIIEQWQKDIIWLQFTGLTDKSGKEIYEFDYVLDRYNQRILVKYEFSLLSKLKEIEKELILDGNYYE